jgi:hypothetical protein
MPKAKSPMKSQSPKTKGRIGGTLGHPGLGFVNSFRIGHWSLGIFPVVAADPKAFHKGTELGCRAMTEGDFTNVNCNPDT